VEYAITWGGPVRERERLAKPRVAVVLGRTLEYGFKRMMQGYSDDWRDGDVLDVGLFYTVEDARAWLGRVPAPGAASD